MAAIAPLSFDIVSAFPEGRDLRQERRSLRPRCRQHAYAAGFMQFCEFIGGQEDNRNLAAHEIGQRKCPALVGDMLQRRAGSLRKHQSEEMGKGTGAGRSKICLGGIGLQPCHEFGKVIGRNLRVDADGEIESSDL